MTTIEPGVVERLQGLLEIVTPLPWGYEPDREGSSMGWIGHQIPAGLSTVFSSLFEVEGDSAQQEINAEFAVEAVNALPSLLALLAQQQARIGEMEDGLNRVRSDCDLAARALGNSGDEFASCERSFRLIGERAAAAIAKDQP